MIPGNRLAGPAIPEMDSPLAGSSTRVRYTVLAFACALSMVTYLDRVSMGTIGPIIRDEWGLSPSQLGWIFTAFGLGYAIFEIPRQVG